jgi:hypothetical protein
VLERDVRFAGWSRPAAYTATNLGRCRGCGAAILWCRTAAGRHAPLDRDGTSHFATCPDAATFRRTVAQKPRSESL